MKKFKPVLFVLLFSFVLFTSCRSEDDMNIDPPAEQALLADSTIANLMSRTSLNDGSFDNIIDNASCFQIQLPVTVTANGVQITVENTTDYDMIEAVFDANNSDTDTLEIEFPITVVFSDFTTTEVNNYPELLALVAQCPEENFDDDDIECLDFLYPITASVFNQNDELINSIVINNDNDMYDFIDDLDDYAAVMINFPITVILADGTNLIVNSISELQMAIENADNSCDEDDDNDYNDDDCDNCTTNEVVTILTNCTNWTVDELELNDNELENQYVGYVFNFEANGTISVTENGNTIAGTWSISGEGNAIDFVIDIPNLTDFNGIWTLEEVEQEFGETEFEFEKANDDELSFKSNC